MTDSKQNKLFNIYYDSLLNDAYSGDGYDDFYKSIGCSIEDIACYIYLRVLHPNHKAQIDKEAKTPLRKAFNTVVLSLKGVAMPDTADEYREYLVSAAESSFKAINKLSNKKKARRAAEDFWEAINYLERKGDAEAEEDARALAKGKILLPDDWAKLRIETIKSVVNKSVSDIYKKGIQA